jgi:N-acetylmuramoyl-L-alanine amidase
VWLPTGEYLTLSARAAEGATVWVRLPSRAVIQLFPRRQPVEVLPGTRGFDRDTTKLSTPDEIRYFGVVRGQALGLNPGPVLGKAGGALPGRSGTAMACKPGVGCPLPERSSAGRPWAIIEAALDGDTARAIWPLQVALLDTLPQVIEVNDDTLGNGETDGLTQGRAVPEGAYHWFLPNGTRAVVSGRLNQDLRLRLSPQAEAWIRVNEARPLPRGMPAPRAVMSSVTVAPLPDRVVLRIPLSERVPFLVTETERSLAVKFYGAAADVDWMHHERESLVQRMTWVQASQDELMLTVDLSEPVWGYRTRWSRNDLLVEIRRPPKISSTSPLRGRIIAVDPGHPPLGATGPTGLREAEANLSVALRLRSLLQAEGARVIMTRTADTAVDLWPRIALAETSGAELFVSIHNDALPDGVNPFTNNGTGVFYNRLRSAPLAAAIQRSLVRRLNLPDRGISRGDLAVVRQTWMPAVLCEGMFVILPEQEARLRSARGQRSYARGVLEGIRSYLVERARSQASGPVGQAQAEASPRAQPNTSPAPPRSGLERGVAP